jgi:hypothetical protein
LRLVDALDVYDSRTVTRLCSTASKSLYFEEYGGARLYNLAASKRYFVILGDGRVAAGSEPRPYFYVYGLDCRTVESVLAEVYASLVDFNALALGEGVREERVDCQSDSGGGGGARGEGCVKAVFVFYDGRWVPAKAKCVYKISVPRPEHVRAAREPVLEASAETRVVYSSGFNIRYPVRVSWDLGLTYVGMKPLYIEEYIPDELPRPRIPILVFDIEVVGGEWLIVSFYRLRLLEEVEPGDVWTVRCRMGQYCDELIESFKGARIVYGHNILGFDIPMLLKKYFIRDLVLASKLDGVKILSAHGQSFQIGASKSLYAVAKRLREAAGIAKEELEIKARSDRILSSGDLGEIERYNRNDVVITAKIANVILPFVYLVSGLTAIPPSVVQELPAGLLAEYLLFRYYEYRGVLIGYKHSNARMVGSKVLLPGALSATRSLLDLLRVASRG